MNRFQRGARRLGRSLDPRAAEREMEEELRQHMEHEIEKNVRAGMSPEEARRRARLDFGGVEMVKEDIRGTRGLPWLESLARDLRFGARSLRRNPGFSLVAVLTLALGIGASTAMFTVVNTVLLRPLGLPEPERLMVVWEVNRQGDTNITSPANYNLWREQATSFQELAASVVIPNNLTGDGEPVEVMTGATTANFFEVHRAAPVLGRSYLGGEESEPSAVLSHRLWQSRYGGDPSVIGRTVTLNGESWTIVGVMPPEFRTIGTRADLWVPMEVSPTWRGRFLTVVGRLRPEVTPDQAGAEMVTIGARLAEQFPEFYTDWGVLARPMHQEVTGDARPALLVLLGAVALLLLIACANVASLLLGRAASRRREMAVRLSLGASRGRLVRQTLTESLLLSTVGGALGLLIALAGTRLLVRVLPADGTLPRLDEVTADARVLAFALGVSLLTGILFGIAPALLGSAVRLAETLREATRGNTGSRSALRRGIVVVEVALAVVLLVGAGLLARSLQRLMAVDTGVRTEQVLTMRLTLTGAA